MLRDNIFVLLLWIFNFFTSSYCLEYITTAEPKSPENNVSVTGMTTAHPLLVDPYELLHVEGETCRNRVLSFLNWWTSNGWGQNEFDCLCHSKLAKCYEMPQYIQDLLTEQTWELIQREDDALEQLEAPPVPDDFFKFLNPNGWNRSDCIDRIDNTRKNRFWTKWNITISYLFELCYCASYNCYLLQREGYSIPEEIQAVIDERAEAWKEEDKRFQILFTKKYFKDNLTIGVISIIITIVLFVWGLSGNLLVMITIWKYLPRQNVTNIFIFNLSLSDVIVILFALPFRVLKGLTEIWFFGVPLCKVMYFVYYMSFMLSVFTQTAMALERYLVIVHPMKAKYISTPGRARRIIAVIWVISLCGASLPAYLARKDPSFTSSKEQCGFWQSMENDDETGYFFESDTNYIILVLFLIVGVFIIPVMMMAIVYTITGKTLYESIKNLKQMTNDGKKENSVYDEKDKKEKQIKEAETKQRAEVVKMLVLLLILFVLTWTPGLIYEALVAFQRHFPGAIEHYKLGKKHVNDSPELLRSTLLKMQEEAQRSRFILTFTTLLTILGSCLNPVLYAYTSRAFKKGLAKTLSLCKCRNVGTTMKGEQSSTSISSNVTASTSGLQHEQRT